MSFLLVSNKANKAMVEACYVITMPAMSPSSQSNPHSCSCHQLSLASVPYMKHKLDGHIESSEYDAKGRKGILLEHLRHQNLNA